MPQRRRLKPLRHDRLPQRRQPATQTNQTAFELPSCVSNLVTQPRFNHSPTDLSRRTGLSARQMRRGLTLGELLAILLLLSLIVITVMVGPSYAPRLPDVNAALNMTATVLLVAGFIQIKRGREKSHKALMLAAFGTSILFLASYLVHKASAGTRPFGGSGAIRTVYLAILLTHSVLAAIVPFLAMYTIWLGLKDRRRQHNRWAKVTLPIWLYVSVTGVVVYLMLYHWYPTQPEEPPADAQPAAVVEPIGNLRA